MNKLDGCERPIGKIWLIDKIFHALSDFSRSLMNERSKFLFWFDNYYTFKPIENPITPIEM